MKNIFKAFYVLAAASFVLASCAKEQYPEPTVGEPEVDGCYGVYFPTQEASGDHTYDPTQEKVISITAKRLVSEGEITVPVVFDSNVEDVFVAGDLIFLDGQDEATFDVRFDDIELGKQSSFSITIEDNLYASKYNEGKTAIEFSILCVQWEDFLNPKTGEPAVVTFTQEFWGETCWAKIKYYEVDGVRTCKIIPTGTHLYNGEYYDGWGFLGTSENEGEGEWTFTWYTKDQNSEGNDFLELPLQMSGWHHSTYDADVYVFDLYHYFLDVSGEISMSFLEFASEYGDPDGSYPCGYYDGNGGFYLFVECYYMFGYGGWWTDTYDIIGVAEGFDRAVYDLEIESDYSSDGVLPVYFASGIDNVTVKYAAYEGELTATQIANKAAEIFADANANSFAPATDGTLCEDEDSDYYGLYEYAAGVSFETTGTYTIVAVGINKAGELTETASVSQWYVAEGDIEDNAVQFSVGTEETPARYSDYDKVSSFAYYIQGVDIIAAKVYVFTAEDFDSDPEACCLYVKEEGNELDEDGISALATAGGYYDVVSDCKALTTYVVCVWATNGSLEDWDIAYWTTDGQPNQLVNEAGDFGYTIVMNQLFWDSEDVCYDQGLALEFNPNTEMYEIPHWGNDVTLKFTIDEEGVVSVPIQSTGVAISSYGTFCVMDTNLCDTFFGQDGVAEYFGYDTTKKGYVSEDGKVINFYVCYCTTEGYEFGCGYETYYYDGAPAAASAAVVAPTSKTVNASGLTTGYYFNIPNTEKPHFEREIKAAQFTVSEIALREHQSAPRQRGRETAPEKRF